MCVICCVLNDGYLTTVGPKGIAGLKDASVKRLRNDLVLYLKSQPEIVWVHANVGKH